MSAPILVVDDDLDIRETIAIALEAAGYPVEAVANGLEALVWIDRHGPPRMILLDMRMPIMNGEELLRELRSHARLGAVPIVVISGDPHARERAAALAVAGCLEKPITLRDLEAAVERFAPRPELHAAR